MHGRMLVHYRRGVAQQQQQQRSKYTLRTTPVTRRVAISRVSGECPRGADRAPPNRYRRRRGQSIAHRARRGHDADFRRVSAFSL